MFHVELKYNPSSLIFKKPKAKLYYREERKETKCKSGFIGGIRVLVLRIVLRGKELPPGCFAGYRAMAIVWLPEVPRLDCAKVSQWLRMFHVEQ